MATKEIVFTTRGANDLKAMFKSLRQEAERANKAFNKVGKTKTKGGTAASGMSRREKQEERLHARVHKNKERVAIKSAARARQAADAASKARISAAKKTADAEIRESKRSSRERIRLLKREASAQRQQDRMERRIANRKALRENTHARRMARARRGQMSLFQDYAMGAGRRGGSLLRGAAGTMGLGAGALAAGGAFAVGSAARQGMALSDTARRLSRKGGGAVSAEDLRSSFQKTALDVAGVKAADVARGTEAFVTKTGDVGAAQRFQKTFAEVGLATGTDIEEIAGAAADLFEKFDVKTVEEMSSAMATLAVQGKRGAFELEDAASQFPKIAAAAAKFGLTGTTGLATLGGMTQIARQATPGGEEAATAVEQMFSQLIKKSDVIEKVTGQKVFKDKGKTQSNDLTDILVGTISGAGGNLKTLEDIFGTRGSRAVSPLVSTYNKARAGATGTDAEKDLAGRKALRDQIERAADSTGALEEIQRDLASAQQDASSRVTAAWERIVIQISNKAMPAMLSAIGSLSAFVEQTDFSGAAAAVGAFTTAALAAARVLHLITEKSGKERENEATAGKSKAQLALNDIRLKKSAITSGIAGRTSVVDGKVVRGEATQKELETLRVLDEQIGVGEGKVGKASAQVGLSQRFNVPTEQAGGLEEFLGGLLHGTDKNTTADIIGGPKLAGGSGERGTLEETMNRVVRELALNTKGIETDLDTMSAGIKRVNESLATFNPTVIVPN